MDAFDFLSKVQWEFNGTHTRLVFPWWKTCLGHEKRRESVFLRHGSVVLRLRGLRPSRGGCVGRLGVVSGRCVAFVPARTVIVSAPLSVSVRCPLILGNFILIAMTVFPHCALLWSLLVGLQWLLNNENTFKVTGNLPYEPTDNFCLPSTEIPRSGSPTSCW